MRVWQACRESLGVPSVGCPQNCLRGALPTVHLRTGPGTADPRGPCTRRCPRSPTVFHEAVTACGSASHGLHPGPSQGLACARKGGLVVICMKASEGQAWPCPHHHSSLHGHWVLAPQWPRPGSSDSGNPLEVSPSVSALGPHGEGARLVRRAGGAGDDHRPPPLVSFGDASS